MQLPTPGRASSRAVPMAPTRWSPAVAALHIGLQDRLNPFAERMGHPLCKTDWAQFEFAVDRQGEFAVPSDPTLSMTYLHISGRLLLRATEFRCANLFLRSKLGRLGSRFGSLWEVGFGSAPRSALRAISRMSGGGLGPADWPQWARLLLLPATAGTAASDGTSVPLTLN